MKTTEIINDLKRLNSYLPKDPRKNYANPLDRMVRELELIREFALQGDQTYVTAMLELNRPAPLPKTNRNKMLKIIDKLETLLEKRGICIYGPIFWKTRALRSILVTQAYKMESQDIPSGGMSHSISHNEKCKDHQARTHRTPEKTLDKTEQHVSGKCSEFLRPHWETRLTCSPEEEPDNHREGSHQAFSREDSAEKQSSPHCCVSDLTHRQCHNPPVYSLTSLCNGQARGNAVPKKYKKPPFSGQSDWNIPVQFSVTVPSSISISVVSDILPPKTEK